MFDVQQEVSEKLTEKLSKLSVNSLHNEMPNPNIGSFPDTYAGVAKKICENILELAYSFTSVVHTTQ